ncbi:MAG: ACT domain-containing protein [Acidobacteriota bacterium]
MSKEESREDLVYRLTCIVYERLGSQADARLVEDLVTAVVQTIGSESVTDGGGSGSRVVVSAFGTSRPGIVAAITSQLAESRYNIVDMNQTVVQGKFAMVLIAEAGPNAIDLSTLRAGLKAVGERVGVQVYTQSEDLFQSMHRV